MKTVKFNLLEIIFISTIILSLTGIFLGFSGLFNRITVSFSVLVIAIVFFLLIKNKKIEREKISPKKILVFLAIFLWSALISLPNQPTIFGGRDEGSYSNLAIILAKNGTITNNSDLIDQFFQIYKPGKALNFPGFYYDFSGNLHSQFLSGYPVFLASFYLFFGLFGFNLASAFTLFFFLYFCYLLFDKLITKTTSNWHLALWILVLLATSLPLIIFPKFTLSEIFFGALLWSSIYFLIRYIEKKDFITFLFTTIPLTLAILSRIEAPIIVFMLFLLLIIKDYHHIRWPKYQLIFLFLGIILFLSIAFHQNFYYQSIKNVAKPLLNKTETITENGLSPDNWEHFFIPLVLFRYNLLPMLLMAIAFLIPDLLKKRKNWQDENNIFVPLVILFPSLFYLLNANISLDHPWMLRRFVFSIIPLSFLYTGFFLSNIQKKNNKVFLLVVFSILIVNLFLIFPNLTKKENRFANFILPRQNQDLLKKTAELARLFSSKDLILVSQKASGSGWNLLSEPLRNLYGLKAVYFFNPKDLEKINKNNFEKIYLIASDNDAPLFSNLNKSLVSYYSLPNRIITPQKDPLIGPNILEFETKGAIYEITK